jgi:hypothetical protein
MIRRLALPGRAAAALCAGSAFALPAFAGNVAWNVSVGGPGFSVGVGQPAWAGWGGPSFRSFAPAPVAVALVPPVVYGAPVIVPVARPWRPVGYRPWVHGPAWRGPVARVRYGFARW